MLFNAWSPTGTDEVKRVYAPDIGLTTDEPDTLIVGRKVYIWPGSYGSPSIQTRASINKRLTFNVTIVERYTTAAGTPPDAWMDARLLFVQDQIFNPLRNPNLVLAGSMFPVPDDEPATITSVYDLDVLIQHRAFWCEASFTYEELTNYGS